MSSSSTGRLASPNIAVEPSYRQTPAPSPRKAKAEFAVPTVFDERYPLPIRYKLVGKPEGLDHCSVARTFTVECRIPGRHARDLGGDRRPKEMKDSGGDACIPTAIGAGSR